MPLYEYQCEACGKRFEVIRRFSDPPLETCTQCGAGPVQRLQSSPAIQFKGSGWYITDYSQKGKPPGGVEAGPEKGKDGKGKDGEKAPAAASEGSDKKPSSSETSSPAPKSDAPAAKTAKSTNSDA